MGGNFSLLIYTSDCFRLSSFYSCALDFNYFRVGMDNTTGVWKRKLSAAHGGFSSSPPARSWCIHWPPYTFYFSSLHLYTNYCTFQFFHWRNSIVTFLFVCLKDTISVQSNSFISCYSLKWSYLNDAVCAVKYKSGSYFRGHLSVTVQYVFSMENSKNIENNIGWCY